MTTVLVVDDSRFMRTIVGDALTDADYEVRTVSTGEAAVEVATADEPDVITMDVEMPGMDGIEAVERIMSTTPTPILMISAHTEQGAEATLDAMERGAIDFLHKPDGSGSRNVGHLADEVVETVGELADADVSSLALAQASATAHATRSERTHAATAGSVGIQRSETADLEDLSLELPSRQFDEPTVVVGASTGGPRIIERILAGLPVDLGATVLIVQHMPPEFTCRFADRLDGITEYDVSEAADGDTVGPGEVLVARGDRHLEIDRAVAGRLEVSLADDEPVNGIRPAIDVTMETAAERVSGPLVGVVLTGMGRDGAEGIEAIKAAGGRTIAQDESTSPVFGIPCRAIETGCVDEVLAADEVVGGIADAVSTEGTTHG